MHKWLGTLLFNQLFHQNHSFYEWNKNGSNISLHLLNFHPLYKHVFPFHGKIIGFLTPLSFYIKVFNLYNKHFFLSLPIVFLPNIVFITQLHPQALFLTTNIYSQHKFINFNHGMFCTTTCQSTPMIVSTTKNTYMCITNIVIKQYPTSCEMHMLTNDVNKASTSCTSVNKKKCHFCRNPTLREVWGRHSHSRKWDLGVLRDS